MLERTFEWERLVHPTPTDDMVTTRKAIVNNLIAAFDSEKDIDEAFRLVAAALSGLNPSIQSDVDHAAVLAETTRKHRPAFPSNLTENAQDLQLSASLAVGELLTRKLAKGTWQEPIPLMAALIVAARHLQPATNGLHLASVHQELSKRAGSLLASEAQHVRTRPEYDPEAFDALTVPGDIPGFWDALKPVLRNSLASLATASSIDRDELEVLWWIYNDSSTTFEKHLSELTAFDIALATPLELVDRALCPAPASLKSIVQGLVARAEKRSKATTKPKPLKTVIAAWPRQVVAALAPTDDDVKSHIQTSPKMLPLTWIALRVKDTGVVTGWEPEFEARIGLKASHKVMPEVIAEQIFAERTVQRLLLPLCGE